MDKTTKKKMKENEKKKRKKNRYSEQLRLRQAGTIANHRKLVRFSVLWIVGFDNMKAVNIETESECDGKQMARLSSGPWCVWNASTAIDRLVAFIFPLNFHCPFNSIYYPCICYGRIHYMMMMTICLLLCLCYSKELL